MPSLRIFAAGLATESNTFAPFPTGRIAFEEAGIFRGSASEGGSLLSPMFRAWKSAAFAGGHEYVEGFASYAQPAGVTVREIYEEYRDEILADIRSRGPFDIILLALHGAMVAVGYDDCEGDLIEKVRAIAPGAVIGAELDPHAHLTERMVEGADVIIAAKEYPHIDFGDRAAELFDLCIRTRLGLVKPVASVFDCHMVGWYPTTIEPMMALVAQSRELEQRPGILSVSIIHGFPWGDVADTGTRTLVIADGDREAAATAAESLGRAIYAHRRALLPAFPTLDQALDRIHTLKGLVVLADVADNAGGGAPADNTTVLRALLNRGVRNAVCGLFWDPVAARICADAGVGAKLPLRLGGKCGPMSSDPLDVTVTVRGIKPDHFQSRTTGRLPLGLSVWLEVDGIDVAVVSVRSQTLSPTGFTDLGIELAGKGIVAVKSSQHFRASFEQIADHIVQVATPGTLQLDFTRIPYVKASQTFFPRVADPLRLGD